MGSSTKNKKKTSSAARRKAAAAAAATSSSSALASQSPEQLLEQAHSALDSCQPVRARKLLAAALAQAPDSLRLLEAAGIAEMEAAAALAAVETEADATLDEETENSIAAATSRAADFFHRAIAAASLSGEKVSSAVYLYMGQLAEGIEAVEFYDQGIRALEAEAVGMVPGSPEYKALARKISSALCSMTEIYMTDCCDHPSAEQNCLLYTRKALDIDSQNPEVHQTYASVLLSQQKPHEARAAMESSLSLWTSLTPSSPVEEFEARWPDYSSRVACSKILLELGMHERASYVLKTCMMENDSDPEIWYLFGWCFYRMGGGEAGTEDQEVAAEVGKTEGGNVSEEERKELWKDARDCFGSMMELVGSVEGGEEGLGDMIAHTQDLLKTINEFLATQMDGDDDDDDDGGEDGEGWIDDNDEEMQG